LADRPPPKFDSWACRPSILLDNQGEYFFPLQGPLGDDAVLVIAKKQELVASLFADRQAVGSAFKLPPPGPHKLAFVIENHHRVRILTGGMHGVMDINVSLRILADAVGIAEPDGPRQFAPVMNGLVLMLPLPQDGRLAARPCRSHPGKRALWQLLQLRKENGVE